MKQPYEHIVELIIKHQENTINDTEKLQLNQWRSLSPKNEICFRKMNDRNYLMEKLIVYASADSKRIWELTQSKMKGFHSHPEIIAN